MNNWCNILVGGILSCKSIFLWFIHFQGLSISCHTSIKFGTKYSNLSVPICSIYLIFSPLHDYLAKSFKGPQRIPGWSPWMLLILIQTVIYRCMLCKLLSLKLFENLCSPVVLDKHGEPNREIFASFLSVPSWREPYFRHNCTIQFNLEQAFGKYVSLICQLLLTTTITTTITTVTNTTVTTRT
jgi:hypothetical protein